LNAKCTFLSPKNNGQHTYNIDICRLRAKVLKSLLGSDKHPYSVLFLYFLFQVNRKKSSLLLGCLPLLYKRTYFVFQEKCNELSVNFQENLQELNEVKQENSELHKAIISLHSQFDTVLECLNTVHHKAESVIQEMLNATEKLPQRKSMKKFHGLYKKSKYILFNLFRSESYLKFSKKHLF